MMPLEMTNEISRLKNTPDAFALTKHARRLYEVTLNMILKDSSVKNDAAAMEGEALHRLLCCTCSGVGFDGSKYEETNPGRHTVQMNAVKAPERMQHIDDS